MTSNSYATTRTHAVRQRPERRGRPGDARPAPVGLHARCCNPQGRDRSAHHPDLAWRGDHAPHFRAGAVQQPTLTGQPSQPRPRAGGGHPCRRAHRTAWPGREHPPGARGGGRARRAAGPRRGGPGRRGGGGAGRASLLTTSCRPRPRARVAARPTAQYLLVFRGKVGRAADPLVSRWSGTCAGRTLPAGQTLGVYGRLARRSGLTPSQGCGHQTGL